MSTGRDIDENTCKVWNSYTLDYAENLHFFNLTKLNIEYIIDLYIFGVKGQCHRVM